MTIPEQLLIPEKQPVEKPFPWRCPKCRQPTVNRVTLPYRCPRTLGGRVVTVEVPNLAVPRCSNCGEFVFDYAADEQIRTAFRTQTGSAMDWHEDATTAQSAGNYPLPLQARVPAHQFPGHNFDPAIWHRRILGTPRWPVVQALRSSPQNIITLFQEGAFLEALTMVVSWGSMGRQSKRIYNRPLAVIRRALEQCAESIQQTCAIQGAWNILTGVSANQLEWSAVMASKTLSFLSRALGFLQKPPVAIDGAVIRNLVWPAFIRNIPVGQRPLDWEGDTFDAYSRYMTAILVWASQRQWTTTELEATVFDEYRQLNNDPSIGSRTNRTLQRARNKGNGPKPTNRRTRLLSNRFGVRGAAGYVIGQLDETPRTEEELIRLAQERVPQGLRKPDGSPSRYATDPTVECPVLRRLAEEGIIIRETGRDGLWRYSLGKEKV
jgi:hypothetical protein